MIVRYIRHGACVGNEHSRATGGLYDHKLSENGIKEIKALVDSGIYPRYPGYCFTSQLSRAYDTLKLIYPNAQIYKTDLLNERSFGEMEFMEDEEEYAYKKAINFDPWGSDLDFRFGGDGESLRQFYKRVKRDFCILLDEFNKNEYELVTICGHGPF